MKSWSIEISSWSVAPIAFNRKSTSSCERTVSPPTCVINLKIGLSFSRNSSLPKNIRGHVRKLPPKFWSLYSFTHNTIDSLDSFWRFTSESAEVVIWWNKLGLLGTYSNASFKAYSGFKISLSLYFCAMTTNSSKSITFRVYEMNHGDPYHIGHMNHMIWTIWYGIGHLICGHEPLNK